MNRKVLALNIALLALAGTLAWLLRANWSTAQSRQRAVLQKKVPPKTVLAPPAQPPVKPVTPADYVDVASKMLFSKDRNPTVVVEPPPVKPEPPMPALPSYHGQMSIGEPVIFLSTGTGAAVQQRSYHAGDTVGEFKVVSFNQEQIDLEWHGKDVQRKLAELKPKETAPPPAPKAAASPAPASSSAPAAPAAAAAKPAVTALGGSSAAADKSVTSLSGPSTTPLSDEKSGDDPLFGPARPDGSRACVASDTSPSGTVHSGYRKIQTMTLFGQVCNWEQVK